MRRMMFNSILVGANLMICYFCHHKTATQLVYFASITAFVCEEHAVKGVQLNRQSFETTMNQAE